jgi:nucleoside-diphosphate-sugar epimerase
VRVFITGSSGFVGRALAAECVRRGHLVCGFSRQPRSHSLTGDLLDVPSVERALSEFQPEIVYHLAAKTALKGGTDQSYLVNTQGVANLLTAVSAQPSIRRVIWMSSQLVSQPGRAASCETDYAPVDAYGESKAAGELMVRAAAGGGKEWVIVRGCTTWGPGMSEHYASVVRMIRRGLYFHVGNTHVLKSFSYIDNLASQLASLADAASSDVHGKTLYLADSEPLDLRLWADAFAEEFKTRIPTVPTGAARAMAVVGDAAAAIGLRAPVTTKRLANMMAAYVHDIRAIDRIHGPTSVPMREGVRRTANWIIRGEVDADPVSSAFAGSRR